MKFKIERTFLVRTEEFIEFDPKNFLHCATIEELNNEIEDKIDNSCEHPNVKGLQLSEEIGLRYYDYYPFDGTKSFYQEWQRLKGLPQEL